MMCFDVFLMFYDVLCLSLGMVVISQQNMPTKTIPEMSLKITIDRCFHHSHMGSSSGYQDLNSGITELFRCVNGDHLTTAKANHDLLIDKKNESSINGHRR